MRNSVIVEKLIVYTDKILDYCKGIDHDAFVSDLKLVEACVFNLSQMGELANRVEDDFARARRCHGDCCMVSAIGSSTTTKA